MHPSSIGDINNNEIRLGPCIAKASIELLKRTGLKPKGLEVCVAGHSENVGKPGAAPIDIGVNQIAEEYGATRVASDADFGSCREVARWIDSVPGGVGPLTMVTLMCDALIAAHCQKRHCEANLRSATGAW